MQCVIFTLQDYSSLHNYFNFKMIKITYIDLHDYLGLYDYFDFENGQPYTIIPYCTVIWDPRVAISSPYKNSP